MTSTPRSIGAVLVLSVVAFLPAGALASHDPVAIQVEGEARDRDAGACASDGEVVNVIGIGLQLPHKECWAEYDVRWVGGLFEPMIRLHPPANECGYLAVQATLVVNHVALQNYFGATPILCRGSSYVCMPTNMGYVSEYLPAGEYTMRLTSKITSGQVTGNQYIDHIRWGPSNVCIGGQ